MHQTKIMKNMFTTWKTAYLTFGLYSMHNVFKAMYTSMVRNNGLTNGTVLLLLQTVETSEILMDKGHYFYLKWNEENDVSLGAEYNILDPVEGSKPFYEIFTRSSTVKNRKVKKTCE